MRDHHRFATRAFVVGGSILFASGLLFIGNRQSLFSRNVEFYSEFDRLNGLQKGAKVRVSGMDAGEGLKAQVPDQPRGRFRLRLRIRRDFHPLVREDSIATIRTTGLGGSSFVDIQKGTPDCPELSSGSTIPSTEPFDVGDLILQGSGLLRATQTSVTALHDSAQRVLESIELAARHSDRTILAAGADLQKVLSSVQQTSNELNEVVAQVAHGQGTVGKLLRDPALADLVDQTVKNAHRSSINLDEASTRMNLVITDFERRDLFRRTEAVLENSRKLTETLNQAVAKLNNGPLGNGTAITDVRDIIDNARISMINLAENTEALKHNFFFRRFFKKRGYFNLDRMTPAQYRKVLVERSCERVWLTKDELFSVASDGREQLTKDGEKRIDGAMGVLIPYLPNNPIVVEGYSTQGSPSERFRRAKQRASVVQTYIRQRFGLPSNAVGTIPMSAAGKSGWNGVSLVLIR